MKHNHSPIVMRRVSDNISEPGSYAGYEHFKRRGDFLWNVHEGRRTLVVAIPSPRGKSGWIMSPWSIDYENTSGASWSWNGDEDKPMLDPSLHAVGIWHGWIIDGVMTEA